MRNMFTAMKEDYGVEAAAFLSTISNVETGRIFLEALKSGVPLHDLKGIWFGKVGGGGSAYKTVRG